MMVQDIEAAGDRGLVDPGVGQRLTDIDLAKRHLSGLKFDHVSGDMIGIGDEKNDEVRNLYRVHAHRVRRSRGASFPCK